MSPGNTGKARGKNPKGRNASSDVSSTSYHLRDVHGNAILYFNEFTKFYFLQYINKLLA